jgi:hypothetical protein
MKMGASSAHLAMACGMMMPTTSVIRMAMSSSHPAPDVHALDGSPSLTAATCGMLE